MDNAIKEFRRRRYDRLIRRGYNLDEEGRWVTTENKHKVHLNGEGEPDKGNPKVIAKMTKGSVVKASKAAKRISKATSVSEVGKALEKEFGIGFTPYRASSKRRTLNDEFHLELIKGGCRSIADSLTEFPALKKYIKGVTVIPNGIACYGIEDRVVAFNPDYFETKNASRFYDTLRKTVEEGWWPKNSSVESIFAHECAHALHDMIAKKKRLSGEAYCFNVVSKAADSLKQTAFGKERTIADMRYSISRQAYIRNTMETVAEAFADCYANGENASPMSVEIRRLVAQDYNKHFSKQ